MHSVGRTKSAGRWARIILSYGVGAACLYWVFYDVRFADVLRSVRRTAWPWLVPAAILDLLVYVSAGWEWQILLRKTGAVSVLRTTQAVFAGRFANDVLPVHVGYLVRVYLMSRWMQVGMARVIPSLLVERLFDGLWLAMGIGLTALSFPLPPEIKHTAEVWAGIIVFGLAALAVIVFRKETGSAEPARGIFRWKWAGRLRNLLLQLLDEVRKLGRSWSFLGAMGISILKLALQGLAFLMLLWAYGFDLALRVQLAVFLIAYVGMSLPSTPASVGVFQFFCVSGLQLFGIPKPAASGFALLAFVVLTLPLSVAGFIALAQSGVTLAQVRREFSQGRPPDENRG